MPVKSIRPKFTRHDFIAKIWIRMVCLNFRSISIAADFNVYSHIRRVIKRTGRLKIFLDDNKLAFHAAQNCAQKANNAPRNRPSRSKDL